MLAVLSIGHARRRTAAAVAWDSPSARARAERRSGLASECSGDGRRPARGPRPERTKPRM